MKLLCLFYFLILLSIIYFSCSKNDAVIHSYENTIKGTWKVIALESDSVKKNLAENDTISISFEDGKINGNSKGLCGNRFSGNYNLQENEIGFSNLSSTEAACPNSLYWPVFHTIERARQYKCNDTLYIFNNLERTQLYLKKL